MNVRETIQYIIRNDRLEAEIAQRCADIGGIIGRIDQLRQVTIAGIADDQRRSLVGVFRCDTQNR